MKNKKCISVLSIIVFTLMIQSIVTFNAKAAVKSYIINDSGKYISFNTEELLEDYANNLMGISSPMYDEYINVLNVKPGLIAFQDDTKGYVSVDSVENAYANALVIGDKAFSIDNFTENVNSSDILNDISIGYEWKDGKIVSVDGNQDDNNSDDFDVVDIY